jgi:hypothetical protein
MTEIFQDVTFSFRFMSLSDRELVRLCTLLPGPKLTSRPRGAGLVVVLELAEDFDIGSLRAFMVECQIDPDTTSVWISLTTSGDQGGVSLPQHVLDIVRRTFCGVDFSFASCLGDDPGESGNPVVSVDG